MKLLPRNLFINNLNAYILRENFIISSLVTIFVIRFTLKITDYPQLAGGGLHIAHVLLGGIIMLIALMMLFSFLSNSTTSLASIIGGIGFGAFIDELGKYITSNNNYFFQPTVALIYAFFVVLYIISKFLSDRKITKQEYLVNALDVIKDAVINDLDEDEKKRAMMYLRKSDQKDPLVVALGTFLKEVDTIASPEPSFIARFRYWIILQYQKATRSQLVTRLVVIILLVQALGAIADSSTLIGTDFEGTFVQIGELLSSLASAFFVLLGLTFYRRSHRRAYRMFKIAVFINLFLTQFFLFYSEQFLALIGLAINLFILVIVDFVLGQEEAIQR